MINSHIEQITKNEKVIDNIICNMCGKPIRQAKNMIGNPMFYDHLKVRKAWGYFSNKEGVEDDFELCEDCYDKIIHQFKIPVKRTE